MQNLTPEKYLCGWGECPAVFRSDDGKILVRGRIRTENIPCSNDEAIVEVPADLFENLVIRS